jgi:hypothetical protein
MEKKNYQSQLPISCYFLNSIGFYGNYLKLIVLIFFVILINTKITYGDTIPYILVDQFKQLPIINYDVAPNPLQDPYTLTRLCWHTARVFSEPKKIVTSATPLPFAGQGGESVEVKAMLHFSHHNNGNRIEGMLLLTDEQYNEVLTSPLKRAQYRVTREACKLLREAVEQI